MNGVNISDLDTASALVGTEVLPLDQAGATVKATVSTILQTVVFSVRALVQNFTAANGVRTQVTFAGTETIDNTNSFSSNTFTCPASGYYYFECQLTGTTTMTVGDVFIITIEQSGSAGINTNTRAYVSANVLGGCMLHGTAMIRLIAGDLVKVWVTREAGTGNFIVTNQGASNCFSGVRVAGV